MEGFSKNEKPNTERKKRQEIFAKVIRAGKRTYFFDVKKTRNEELYLTITESKKRFVSEGRFHYEKHKIFLYKEDFDKFIDSLHDVVNYITERQPYDRLEEQDVAEVVEEEVAESDYTDVDFEDLTK